MSAPSIPFVTEKVFVNIISVLYILLAKEERRGKTKRKEERREKAKREVGRGKRERQVRGKK